VPKGLRAGGRGEKLTPAVMSLIVRKTECVSVVSNPLNDVSIGEHGTDHL